MNTNLAIENGVDLDELPVGALLDVETANTRYRIENRGHGEVLISGHPDICPQPIPVNFYGSMGESTWKLGSIERDLRMEFLHPSRGIVRTSPVRDVRKRTSTI